MVPTDTTQTANPDLERVARKLVWWKAPADALRHPLHFVAQAMTFGTWQDVQITRAALGEDWFRQVLKNPPAGIFDEASWAYWHNVFGVRPVPPLPRCRFS